MFSGGSRSIAPQYWVEDNVLQIRPYNAKLTELTNKICKEAGKADDICLFETRTAFDCLLRKQVTKYGNLTDNVGACKHHIANMRTALGPESKGIIDNHIEKVVYARQSFV